MRRIISLLMSLMVCFSLSERANAQSVPISIVQPYYEMVYENTTCLTVSGTKATCDNFIRGNSSVVEITAEQYLQKQGFLWIWSTYDDAEWTKTVRNNSLTMSNSKSGLSSGKYRLKTIFTLTNRQGKTEKITVYSDEKSVG